MLVAFEDRFVPDRSQSGVLRLTLDSFVDSPKQVPLVLSKLIDDQGISAEAFGVQVELALAGSETSALISTSVGTPALCRTQKGPLTLHDRLLKEAVCVERSSVWSPLLSQCSCLIAEKVYRAARLRG